MRWLSHAVKKSHATAAATAAGTAVRVAIARQPPRQPSGSLSRDSRRDSRHGGCRATAASIAPAHSRSAVASWLPDLRILRRTRSSQLSSQFLILGTADPWPLLSRVSRAGAAHRDCIVTDPTSATCPEALSPIGYCAPLYKSLPAVGCKTSFST